MFGKIDFLIFKNAGKKDLDTDQLLSFGKVDADLPLFESNLKLVSLKVIVYVTKKIVIILFLKLRVQKSIENWHL